MKKVGKSPLFCSEQQLICQISIMHFVVGEGGGVCLIVRVFTLNIHPDHSPTYKNIIFLFGSVPVITMLFDLVPRKVEHIASIY